MDTNARKTNLESLLQKQKEKERNDEIQMQLGWILEPFSTKEGITLLGDEEREKMKSEFIESIPIIEWVSLDLEKMNNKFVIYNVSSDKVTLFLKDKELYTENSVYLFLQDDLPPFSTLPWVKMPLSKVIENIAYLAAEDSYQQYIFCPTPKFVIEFVEPDLITIAW
ncbi:hypothetical protein [Psychrobacillus sp. FJAT-21963]|uniref:CDI toxin immunity protein n=1 Tax=Psychrobacillus sp. FJAT-21963 TaxID=1712028 RepID=UPI000700F1A0|nr:hypothetical protein [Psychrobacillus sp. FJAT-21963]KQL34391.1 hypothetical protein AN959_15450 [Psychrobacillus sp. FJAT-21963]